MHLGAWHRSWHSKYPVTVSYCLISFLVTFINVYTLPFQVLPSAGALGTFLRDFAARYMCTRNMQSTIAHGGRGEPPPPRGSAVLRILAEFLRPARPSGVGRWELPPTWVACTVHASWHFWDWPQSKPGSGYMVRLLRLQGTLSFFCSFSRLGVAWEELKRLYSVENVFTWSKCYNFDKNIKKNQIGILKYMKPYHKHFLTPRFSSGLCLEIWGGYFWFLVFGEVGKLS